MAKFKVSYELLAQGLHLTENNASVYFLEPHNINTFTLWVVSPDLPDNEPYEVPEIDPPIFYRQGDKVTIDWGIKDVS